MKEKMAIRLLLLMCSVSLMKELPTDSTPPLTNVLSK
jgi:hypothetical protein